jgi:predicted molibdopterin-dependent oxidoreductase YjgC
MLPKAEPELVILYSASIKGDAVRQLGAFADSLGIPVKYVPLVDYSNSRGAVDMGLVPGPGGMTLPEMLAAEDLDVLWVVGANTLSRAALRAQQAFVVVQDLFLTETAARADVVFPAACGYEKSGTVTNTCGECCMMAATAIATVISGKRAPMRRQMLGLRRIIGRSRLWTTHAFRQIAGH